LAILKLVKHAEMKFGVFGIANMKDRPQDMDITDVEFVKTDILSRFRSTLRSTEDGGIVLETSVVRPHLCVPSQYNLRLVSPE